MRTTSRCRTFHCKNVLPNWPAAISAHFFLPLSLYVFIPTRTIIDVMIKRVEDLDLLMKSPQINQKKNIFGIYTSNAQHIFLLCVLRCACPTPANIYTHTESYVNRCSAMVDNSNHTTETENLLHLKWQNWQGFTLNENKFKLNVWLIQLRLIIWWQKSD